MANPEGQTWLCPSVTPLEWRTYSAHHWPSQREQRLNESSKYSVRTYIPRNVPGLTYAVVYSVIYILVVMTFNVLNISTA